MCPPIVAKLYIKTYFSVIESTGPTLRLLKQVFYSIHINYRLQTKIWTVHQINLLPSSTEINVLFPRLVTL